MRLVMLQPKDVYGKKVNVGEEFEVPDNEGVTWVKLGFAKIATRPPVRETKVMTSDPQQRKGRYTRSDMRAEDEAE